jgi:ABC-type oligopeptide transport system substrate-binding subunit
MRVEYFADSSAALEAFKAGVYTFRNENSARDWATGYNFPAVAQGQVKVEELPDGTIGSGQAFVFNLRKPEWQDPAVREAVRMMFNFEWSNDTLFFGLYERVNSFWENSDLEATGVPSEGRAGAAAPARGGGPPAGGDPDGGGRHGPGERAGGEPALRARCGATPGGFWRRPAGSRALTGCARRTAAG